MKVSLNKETFGGVCGNNFYSFIFLFLHVASKGAAHFGMFLEIRNSSTGCTRCDKN
jgi:hypothetical protein